jgi:hypothetical protein
MALGPLLRKGSPLGNAKANPLVERSNSGCRRIRTGAGGRWDGLARATMDRFMRQAGDDHRGIIQRAPRCAFRRAAQMSCGSSICRPRI